MVRTETIALNDVERTIVDAFGGESTSTVVAVVRDASARWPASRVRESYWELVSEGVLVPSASGVVRLDL